jgi:hypothetical protein
MINLIALSPGTVVNLITGDTAVVVENMGDGQWVSVRYLTTRDPALAGIEELCHAQDIAGIAEQPPPARAAGEEI